jgi:Gly-Xaa carboxypeptidase
VKVNALPEQATAVVNHRISVDSSVKEIHQRYIKLLTPVAKRFNLTVVGTFQSGGNLHATDGLNP